MKVFSSVFWAVMLILAGVLVLVNHLFNLDIKVFGVLFGVFVILLGISIITGNSGYKGDHTVVFSSSNRHVTSEDDVNVIFSSSNVNLDDFEGKSVEVNSIFSSVNLKSSRPMKIKASCAFGSVQTRDGGMLSFGDRKWDIEGEGEPINVEINCVFGSVKVN